MLTMKYLVAVLLSWTGAQAAPPQAPPPPTPGLRQALEQFHPGGGIPQRELSPIERAELRRQLSEFGQPANPIVQRGPLEPMPPVRRR
jgi:hypothetical protein